MASRPPLRRGAGGGAVGSLRPPAPPSPDSGAGSPQKGLRARPPRRKAAHGASSYPPGPTGRAPPPPPGPSLRQRRLRLWRGLGPASLRPPPGAPARCLAVSFMLSPSPSPSPTGGETRARVGGRWKAPCQSSGRAEKKASEGEGGRTAFPGEGAAVVAASLAALPGGHLQRRGWGGKEGVVLHHRPFPPRGGEGGGSSPAPSSPVPPFTHTHSAATGTGTGGWRLLCLAGAPSGGVRAQGKAGRCGGLCVRVCRGLRGRRAGGGGPPAPAAGRGASPACVSGRGVRGDPPQLSPRLGNFLRLRGAS